MKIEDQVISLELAKRLKELKVKQESFWAWYETTDRDDIPRLNRFDENCPACTLKKQNFEEKYSAFTTSELGEMLPAKIKGAGFRIYKDGKNNYSCEYYDGGFGDEIKDKNITNCLAKMLIYLMKNGLIKEEEEEDYICHCDVCDGRV